MPKGSSIIRQVFNPERGQPSLDLRAGRKALNDFKKVCADQRQVLDLMLVYVEEGVTCTRSYGKVDAAFYNSLLAVYRAVVQALQLSDDPELLAQFLARCIAIARDANAIGWGFSDGLADALGTILPEEMMDPVESPPPEVRDE